MRLDSYLEVFTTLFGFMFYDVLWGVLLQTGIVYLPFLGILLEHWKKPAFEARIDSASEWSIRSVEFDLFAALFVVVLAAQPSHFTPLRMDSLHYTPAPTINNPDPQPVQFSSSDSTFGHTGFVDPSHTVETPAWWYAVLALSSGLNHAIIEGLPRSSELRQTIQLSRIVTIEDATAREQLAQFYNDCYVPSRSRYHREQPEAAEGLLQAHGLQELDWIGSQVYRNLPGYYVHFRASSPVKGWPFLSSRDTEYDPAAPPEAGRPFCKEWWEHPQRGLRETLISTVNVQASGYAALLVGFGLHFNTEEHKDILAKTALLNRPATWSNNELVQHNTVTDGWMSNVESTVKSVLGGLGITIAAATTTLTISILLQLLPILQALILLGIYAVLPWILLLSRYSFGVMFSMGITIFGIKFWTVLWYLAQWVDQNLITSMYPDTNVLIENFLLQTEHSSKRVLLNTATLMMYIGFPVLWSIALGWAGIRAGRTVDSVASPYGRIAGDASNKGMAVTKKFS